VNDNAEDSHQSADAQRRAHERYSRSIDARMSLPQFVMKIIIRLSLFYRWRVPVDAKSVELTLAPTESR
jgi:hypothetical protein